MSKQGVKRGSTRTDSSIKKQLVDLVNAYNSMQADANDKLLVCTATQQIAYDREVRHLARVWMQDMFVIALGRMGWREKRIKNLNDLLCEVIREYGENGKKDGKDDPELVYTSGCFERELKSYVGSLYVPKEERY